MVIRGNEYGETKSYIGSAKTLIAFDDMAANPDTDVVSGRIWQGHTGSPVFNIQRNLAL